MQYVCLVYQEAALVTHTAATAATLRCRGGRLSVTDGPFAEAPKLLGVTVIEARDLNEAILLASRDPAARLHAIEVRPLA